MSNTHAGNARPDRQLSLLTIVEAEPPSRLAAENVDEAREEKRFRRMLARKERLGDLSGMAACYIRLGDLFLSRGDSEQAGEMYRKSLKLARAANSAKQGIARDDLL